MHDMVRINALIGCMIIRPTRLTSAPLKSTKGLGGRKLICFRDIILCMSGGKCACPKKLEIFWFNCLSDFDIRSTAFNLTVQDKPAKAYNFKLWCMVRPLTVEMGNTKKCNWGIKELQ